MRKFSKEFYRPLPFVKRKERGLKEVGRKERECKDKLPSYEENGLQEERRQKS